MIPQEWIEPIGLIASTTVAVSLMMSQIFWLRIVNGTGAFVFVFYGVLISSPSIILLNSFVVLINLFYLFISRPKEEDFSLSQELTVSDSWFLRFWNHYAKEIHNVFPNTNLLEWENPKIFFVLRNTLPVNLVVLQKYRDEGWEILVDFVIPEYRDFKNASYFFRYGIHELNLKDNSDLIVFSRDNQHKRYLERIGFHRTDSIGNLEKFIFFWQGKKKSLENQKSKNLGPGV